MTDHSAQQKANVSHVSNILFTEVAANNWYQGNNSMGNILLPNLSNEAMDIRCSLDRMPIFQNAYKAVPQNNQYCDVSNIRHKRNSYFSLLEPKISPPSYIPQKNYLCHKNSQLRESWDSNINNIFVKEGRYPDIDICEFWGIGVNDGNCGCSSTSVDLNRYNLAIQQ